MSAIAAQRVVPEVPLKYSEFQWSLEKLKYKEYGPKMQEKDWFKINSLEVVLLGSKALCSAQTAKRDQGTLMLTMEDITPHIRDRPLTLLHLAEVLLRTTKGPQVPTPMRHRCYSALADLWTFCNQTTALFGRLCRGWFLTVFYQALGDAEPHGVSPDIRIELEPFLASLTEARDRADGVISEAAVQIQSVQWIPDQPPPPELIQGCGLSSCSTLVLKTCLSEGVLKNVSESNDASSHLVTKLFLASEMLKGSAIDRALVDVLPSFLGQVFISSANAETVFCKVLDLLSVISLQLTPKVIEDCGSQTSFPAQGQPGSPGSVEVMRPGESTEVGATTDDGDQIVQVRQLIVLIKESIQKWQGLAGGSARSVVAEGIVDLAVVLLSGRDFGKMLTDCLLFFQQPLVSLMQYASEGYLSDKPEELMIALLSYVSAYVETGTAPNDVITIQLPNLFGPIFGVRCHEVSLELLKFAKLAANSKSRHKLLSESIHDVVRLYKSFQPALIQQAATDQLYERYHAVCAAVGVVAEVMANVTRSISEPSISPSRPQLLGEEEKATAVSCNDEPKESAQCPDDNGVTSTSTCTEGSLVHRARGDEASTTLSEDTFPKSDNPPFAAGNGNRDDNTVTGYSGPTLDDESVTDSLEATSSLTLFQGVNDAVSLADSIHLRARPTISEIEEDSKLRKAILLRLLQLANAMVMNGDDISFVYRSELPKLLLLTEPSAKRMYSAPQCVVKHLPPVVISPNANQWAGDKRRFSIRILDLAVKSTLSDVATPFRILGIVVPKIARNVESLQISDQEKITMVTDLCEMTADAIDQGGDVQEMIANGLDLISSLLEPESSPEEFKTFAAQMLDHLLKPSQASVLFLIRNAAHKLLHNTQGGEKGDIRKFFRKLIFKGRKNEIRCVYRLVSEEFCRDRYLFARELVYSYASSSAPSDGLTGKQVAHLSDTLVPILVLEQGPVKRPGIRTLVEEEEDPEEIERHAQEEIQRRETISKLLDPCVETLRNGLSQKFSRDVCEEVSKKVSLISLFRTLFWSDLHNLHRLSSLEVEEYFQSKLPASLLSDARMMSLLGTTATRLEHTQVPRYSALKQQVVRVLECLVAAQPAQASTSTDDEVFRLRSEQVERFILDLPWNQPCLERLTECGYKEQLWSQRNEVSVTTDGSFSLEENLRQSLLANFAQYSDILRQMGIRHLDVDGEVFETQQLFSDDLTLAELKGRRALAVKTIDGHLGPAKEGLFQEKKISLLMKEDEIETSIEKQAQQPLKPQTFRCALNSTFIDCMSCCGGNIIGCYAPNGDHCERPLEIGMRVDSAVLSIYDSKDVEIENVEVLFCEEGMFVFKSYSNGHPFDTSEVWLSMFSKLLAAPLVPAVVVPQGHPNESTWRALHLAVPTEVTGSMLTVQFDASTEWATYYDHRPERIRCGQDIVLYPQFALKTEGSLLPQLLQRQRSKLNKDLAGMIFDSVIQDLLADPQMQEFRVLGKVISMYISALVQSGARNSSIIAEGFDYRRWRKSVGGSSEFASLPKESITPLILAFIDSGVESWLRQLDLREFLGDHPKQTIELKIYLEKISVKSSLQKAMYKQLKSLLMRCTRHVGVADLPRTVQVDLMNWIFNNEDRVWRYRGGRDRCETLQQYLKFLGPTEANSETSTVAVPSKSKTYPGVVILFLPGLVTGGQNSENVELSFKIRDVVGYAVGEVVSPAAPASDLPVQPRPSAMPTDHEHLGQVEQLSSRQGTDQLSSLREKQREETEEQEGRKVLFRPQSEHYEVVTAYVHPNFRRLGLSVNMYYSVIGQAPSGVVVCDMLRGSVGRIIASSSVFGMLRALRLTPLVLVHQDSSYTVDTQLGNTENFERVAFRVRPIRIAMWISTMATRLWLIISYIPSLLYTRSADTTSTTDLQE